MHRRSQGLARQFTRIDELLELALAAQGGITPVGPPSGVYNVKSYGAVGNGIVDDGPAFQRAANAAITAGGGIVFAPPATYLINTAVAFGSNVSFEGVRGATVLRTTVTTSGYKVLSWVGAGEWSCTDFIIAGQNSSAITLIYVENSFYFSIERIELGGAIIHNDLCGIWINATSPTVPECGFATVGDIVGTALGADPAFTATDAAIKLTDNGGPVSCVNFTGGGNIEDFAYGIRMVGAGSCTLSGDWFFQGNRLSQIDLESSSGNVFINPRCHAGGPIVTPTTWAPGTVYAANSYVVPSPGTGFYYKTLAGGTSGGSQPAFTTAAFGQTTTDNTVTWVQWGVAGQTSVGPHISLDSGSFDNIFFMTGTFDPGSVPAAINDLGVRNKFYGTGGTNQSAIPYLSGTTGQRPGVSSLVQAVGEMYFDTTLGSPVWWNGQNDGAGAWVNTSATPLPGFINGHVVALNGNVLLVPIGGPPETGLRDFNFIEFYNAAGSGHEGVTIRGASAHIDLNHQAQTAGLFAVKALNGLAGFATIVEGQDAGTASGAPGGNVILRPGSGDGGGGLGLVDIKNATTSTSATAGGQTLPVTPVGFLSMTINGAGPFKIPYYNA